MITPTFYGDFMTYHRHFAAKKHRPRWFRAKNLCAYCVFIFIIFINYFILLSYLFI